MTDEREIIFLEKTEPKNLLKVYQKFMSIKK